MNQDLLDLPFFNSHPRLQGVLEYFFKALTSSINVGLLAILGIIITLALAFDNLTFAIVVSIAYGFVQLFITTYVLYLVITSDYLYRIRKYDLVWEIEDEIGNMAFFTLEQDIVLQRMTNTISLFFPLDIYVDEIEAYEFLPLYYGNRKHFLAYLHSFRRAGSTLSVKVRGQRNINVNRKRGNSIIEIPVDFPINELNIVIKFRKLSNVTPELFIRNGGVSTLIGKNDDKCSVSKHSSDSGCLINCRIIEPKFGNSYLITWRLPS